MPPATDFASFVGGFVAAEGSFTVSGQPSSFTFAVGLGALDERTCQALLSFLGVGRLIAFPRRKSHYDDELCFAVRSLPALVEVVVPFMDEHLPPSYKRTQYEAWRARLLHYWEHDAKRSGRARSRVANAAAEPRACAGRTTMWPSAAEPGR